MRSVAGRSLQALAIPRIIVSNSKNSGVLILATWLVAACTAPAGPRMDNIPMYGQPEIVRPESFKRLDEEFIAQASQLGSREKASQVWWAQAEEFMQQKNLDYAMRRYNQSWLLNPNNYQPYWGFGRVMLQQGKCDEAIRHFSRARELVDDKYQKAALVSDLGIAYGYCAKIMPMEQRDARARYFANSNSMFAESTSLDPAYPNAWFRWSQVLLEEDRPAEAWEKLKRAKAAGFDVPPPYVERLTNRMPEPK
jgi:tetratricopeptide (TPR) repeat protein